MTFELILTAPPSANTMRSAFVVNGHVKQVKSPAYTKWLKLAGKELLEEKAKSRFSTRMPPPPYEISIYVGECNIRRDLDNFNKPILDFLKTQGLIEDDSVKFVHSVLVQKSPFASEKGKVRINIDYFGENE